MFVSFSKMISNDFIGLTKRDAIVFSAIKVRFGIRYKLIDSQTTFIMHIHHPIRSVRNCLLFESIQTCSFNCKRVWLKFDSFSLKHSFLILDIERSLIGTSTETSDCQICRDYTMAWDDWCLSLLQVSFESGQPTI
jgi:hypothetical protein